MDRRKLHAIFLRNRGELSKLASELGVHHASLTNWLQGNMNSRPLERAICKRAEDLLAREEQEQLTFNASHPRLAAFAALELAA